MSSRRGAPPLTRVIRSLPCRRPLAVRVAPASSPRSPRALLRVMRGDHAWGTVRDEDDAPYVVRWRVVRNGAEAVPAGADEH